MNPVLETTWLLKSVIENNDLIMTIGKDFVVEIDAPISSEMTVYDDFDANLWNANHILCRLDKQIFQLHKNSSCIAEVRAAAKTRFWWDLPDSDVKDTLKKIIRLRAVMPVASLRLYSSHFSLRNSDDKIVAKGQLSQSIVGEHSLHYLTLKEMRGYNKCFSQAKKRLKTLLDREVPDFCLKTMLIEQKLMGTAKQGPPPVHLTPQMPAEIAVRTMAVAMIAQAILNVDGVVSDTDTVFLHQFRVSVRKLRSLTSLLKKSLPPSTLEIVAPKLSDIAGKTSRLRDLDVFLLEKDSYRTLLPELHEDGLNVLYTLVEKQRQQENIRLARYFLSSKFQQDIAECKAELAAEPAFSTPMSKEPVLSVAKSLLIRRYRKILSMSMQLNATSDDEDVHDIRKEFKKFRYLIEFFIELLPKKRTSRLLAQLKRLQLTLGQFNDYCVQIEFLHGFDDDSQIEMTKALSGLTAILHHKQIETRNQVEAALARFFTDEMAMEIELAFGAKSIGDKT
ncbi:CHAD domain-containing protein [Granulosicoccus antarcticus]|uniref:CHAD domain-containing protein n=1 Tax=Granulosicoccus antarcticus IMCC3135 TaxID=1192854 RepID=A0A2Z2NYG5_9GAMM|nr:CHAD domain-containing protein [Granulosicoccus antarcticus]ASJ76359.1 hypothetical protein IMCC3135_31560 [Granulosicoccus antarcticus IMCC3135]